MKNRLITLTLFLILVVPGVAAFAPLRQDQAQVDLTISAGYGGYYRLGQWTPVRINVSNAGADLEGEARVRTGGIGGLEQTTYSTPLSLPRGARKQVFLYVSLDDFTQRIQVEIVDQMGAIVERETANLRMANRSDLLMAVITESAFGATDLTALTPGTGSARQTNWRLDHIPPLADALLGLDVIMFHDADTGALRAEQTAALAQWVLNGGHLIVAGGDAWQRTTAGLQDLLPVTLQGAVSLDTLQPLADYLRLPSTALAEGITAASNTPAPGARTLVTVDGVPVVVRGEYGGGVVDFLAVDPNAEPLRSWSDRGYLWYTLLASVGQRPSWTEGFSDWSMAREATLTTFNTVLPTFLQLCGFLTLYIILLGPINYLVLKRINRREWAWFTIPGLILVFSVLAYSVGFNLRGNNPTVNRLTVVRVWAEHEEGQVMSLVGVQSPRRSTYDITVERGYTLRTLPDEGIGLNVPALISEGTLYAARAIPIDAGTIASFAASGYRAAPSVDASAVWHLSAAQSPYITGSVTNTTGVPLEDAVILVKGEARPLGTLQSGETRRFDITLGPQDPAPLSLGSAVTRYSPYSYRTWGYGASLAWCFSPQGLFLTIRDVMGEERFVCSSAHVSDRQQEIRRRYRLLGALITDVEVSGGRGGGAFLFAWTHDALVAVDTGTRQAEEDTTLYIFDLPVTVVDDDEIVEIPPGMTTWTIIEKDDPDTMLDIGPDSFQVNNNARAAFQFMPMPEVRLSAVDELVVKYTGQGPLVVELWNWRAQAWVPIPPPVDGTDSTVIPAPARFIGPENAVNVRVYARDPNAYNRVDHIKIAYHGRVE